MQTVRLTRDETGPLGTFGRIVFPAGELYALERPTTGDHPCVREGSRVVDLLPHPEHGLCFQLRTGAGTVDPGRSAILIHPANWYDQLLGCIALGRSIQQVEGEWPKGTKRLMKGITSSKDAVSFFMNQMGKDSFILEIVNNFAKEIA